MKKLLILVAAALISGAAIAQTGNIAGRVADLSDSTAVAGAQVELTPAAGGAKKHATSAANGAFTIQNAEYGTYRLTVSMVGYKPLSRSITLSGATLNLGTLRIEMEAKKLDDVVVNVIAMRTSQKGDTVVYNADAFKVTKDADAEGLLSKLPGVRIVDGQVEAQGETVRKVLVDGKEFFGEDVNSAIKNLPAEAIAKIEVYNKQSDQAEFSGIDDGQGYKAINIVTKVDMRQGQFGKLYAGYGFWDKYIAGGSVNVFSGTNRWSFIGLSNNMNQQNFSMEDILGVTGGGGGGSRRYSRGGRGGGDFMVPQQSGVSKVNSFGVNYSGEWGKKVTFSGSYFFNTNDTGNENRNDREYYPVDDPLVRRLYSSESSSHSTNFNNRINGRVEWKINDNHSVMFRPSFSFQRNFSNSLSQEDNGSGHFEGNELISVDPISTSISGMDTGNKSFSTGYNMSNFLLYRAKLGKPGRTFTVDGSLTLSRNDRNSYNDRNTVFYSGDAPDQTRQRRISDSDQYRVRLSANYTEPLTAKSQIGLQYRYSYSDQPADRKVYLWDYAEQRYNEFYDDGQSDVYKSTYTTNSIGPSFNYANDKKTVLVFNVGYQSSELSTDRELPTPPSYLSARFDNVVYFGMLNQTFSPNNTLRVFMRSETNNPSISQLQDTPDISNKQNVTAGNSALRPSYENNLYLNYNRSMVAKGRTLMLMLGGSVRSNYITESLIQLAPGEGPTTVYPGVTLSNGGQFSRPVNVDGYYTMRSMVNYGTPIVPIKCNFNINMGVDWGRTPSYINGQQNISSTFNYNGGVALSSNISENLDFTLKYSAGWNVAHNSISDRNDNQFLNQSAEGNFKWVMWGGFTLSANATYLRYSSPTNNYKEEYCRINVLAGKKIFRNQRGEINFGVSDLLNQNRSYSRSFSSQYVQDSYNMMIGRFCSINLIYNLRNFGKRKPSKQAPQGGYGEGRHQFFGPPPSGAPSGGPQIMGGGPGGGML